MNFNSKQTYLDARAQWRVNYKELSHQLREARQVYHEGQRAHTQDPKSYYSGGHLKAINGLRAYESLKQEANGALTELATAKVEANRQWLAHTSRPVHPA